ncbi:hypothetical protein CFC21_112726, partial [Triticum aestivum]
QVFFA